MFFQEQTVRLTNLQIRITSRLLLSICIFTLNCALILHLHSLVCIAHVRVHVHIDIYQRLACVAHLD
jgi:hypothetical protein